jgi:hypothetical protein
VLLEKPGQPVDIAQRDDQIDVLVWTSLGLEQRVDSPASVEPDVNPGLADPSEKLDQVGGGNCDCRLAATSTPLPESQHHDPTLRRPTRPDR